MEGGCGPGRGLYTGKPVENWTRDQIETYLKSYGQSDIQSYIPFDEAIPLSDEESTLYHHPRTIKTAVSAESSLLLATTIWTIRS